MAEVEWGFCNTYESLSRAIMEAERYAYGTYCIIIYLRLYITVSSVISYITVSQYLYLDLYHLIIF